MASRTKTKKVTVEEVLEVDEPPAKRRRGRPRANPSSIPVNKNSTHSSSSYMAQAQAFAAAHAGVKCDPGDVPPPDDPVFGAADSDTMFMASRSDDDSTSQKKSRWSNNDDLRDWLDKCADEYLEELYQHDAPPTIFQCTLCSKPSEQLHRCTSCVGGSIYCSECIARCHQRLLTHRIQTWDGSSWVNDDLYREGIDMVIYLGHSGLPCPSNKGSWNLLVGDLNGFMPTQVRYCTCGEKPLERRLQLLRAGLFPCSHVHPRSAMTLPLLEMYNLLTTVGRTSGHKYYSVLEQFTKPGFPDEVDDRYRQLMWTHRRYMHLAQLRLSGHLFPPHPDIDSNPGDQSFDCVACPRPGFNFEWDEVSEEELHWFRLWYSYDGNFRSVRKSKKVDTSDIACSDDLAYFVIAEVYKTWLESIPQSKREVKPACDNHKAGNDTSVRWVGNDITGIGAWSCTSHSCVAPHAVVNFLKGERFNSADYALAMLLSHLLKRRGGRLPIGITYDVWCHYKVNLFERLKLVPPSITVPDDLDLVGAIPKWHLIGHQRQCFVRYSLDNMPFVGRLEGEGVERFWAHLNQHSGSTSEQSPGYRTDTVNNIIREWNKDKAYGMHTALPARYKDAKKMLAKEKAIHDDLNDAFEDKEEVERWRKESIEAVQGKDGEWLSPLMDPELPSGGFHEVVKGERKKESPTARIPGRRPGAARWVSDGIELEHSIRKYNDEAKELGDSVSPRRAEQLNTKRLTLRDRVDKFLRQREYYMPDIPDPDLDKPRLQMFYEEGEDEEGVDLGMPSSYKPETLKSTGLSSMADLEKELRRGMCNESIASVKRGLGIKAQAVKYKKRHVQGQVATTRAEGAIRGQQTKIRQAGWRYSNSYEALKFLGLSEDDQKHYQDLVDTDLTYLRSYYEDYANRKKGEQKPKMSWIWRTSAVPNSDESDVQGLKTEWFRSRERYRRWEEQLVLTKREMVMTIRSFQRYEELWMWKSKCLGIAPGMRAYAFNQAKFFAKLAQQMLVSCHKEIYDDTVELKWCSGWLRKNVEDKDGVITFIKKI